jgi:hypothetical protein
LIYNCRDMCASSRKVEIAGIHVEDCQKVMRGRRPAPGHG